MVPPCNTATKPGRNPEGRPAGDGWEGRLWPNRWPTASSEFLIQPVAGRSGFLVLISLPCADRITSVLGADADLVPPIGLDAAGRVTEDIAQTEVIKHPLEERRQRRVRRIVVQ